MSDGEFVLGYRNEYGFGRRAGPRPRQDARQERHVPRVPPQTQDVAGFWNFIDAIRARRVTRRSRGARLARAKLVGRWKSGVPLVLAPGRGRPERSGATDAFGYGDDPQGFGCPFGAHARRSNPRDGLLTSTSPAESVQRVARHRLLRRGRSYGPRIADPLVDDGKSAERGLHFICLCADIERQFEFVQQTWINNPVFGQLVGEVDPLVGAQTADDAVFTVQAEPVRQRVRTCRTS